MIFSHVTLGCSDVARAGRFYDAVLAPLGIGCRQKTESYLGYGLPAPADIPLWVGHPWDGRPASAGNGAMVAFLAASRGAVDAFHRAGLDNGGRDEGAPGLRPQYHPHYYGAYLRDPDGNKIAVACNEPA